MKYIYIYISFLVFTISKSQNLVPNGSFENYTQCPNAASQIIFAVPWSNATNTGTADYFNICGSSGFSTPLSIGNSYQNPHFGDAYASIVGIGEYLQVLLANPLEQNKTYYVEFFVILSDAAWASGCNNISANLSVTKPVATPTTTGVSYEVLSITPHIQISGNPVINDTTNWVQISGCYTAQGGEEYLTIGNFFDAANTQTNGTGTPYYFVDDVRVEEISGVCVAGLSEFNNNYQLEVYPNPTANNLNITLNGLNKTEHLTVKITDVLGREVLKETYKGELDISGLEKGIYFVSIIEGSKTLVTKKVIKE